VAHVVQVRTAVPPHRFTQAQVLEAARSIFGPSHYLAIFENAGIRARHLACPLEHYGSAPRFGERNRQAVAQATALAEAAARGLTEGVRTLISVTTTALATPSLDTMLMRRLSMDPGVRRVPLFGVGCAGGAAGLACAATWASEGPVLVVASEVCSLTFLPTDRSPTNIVAAALFADGAAAARIEARGPGPRILKHATRLFADSEGVMGWDFTDDGLKLVLSQQVPEMVRRRLAPMIRAFVEDRPIRHWILHPGGPKVLEAYAEALGLNEAALEPSRSFLARYGNLSSACVLFILEDVLARGAPGEFGLVASVGPGFAGELVLLQW
jgi:alkylresorcinol/alkylpyrone synthase